jgi:hypothetical protein
MTGTGFNMRVVAALAAAAHEIEVASDGKLPFERAVRALASELSPVLPARADGQPWSAQDVEIAAAAARAPWLRVAAKTEPR